MRIVKSEVIYLSEDEIKAFAKATRVLEDVIRESKNPSNVMKAKCSLDYMNCFLDITKFDWDSVGQGRKEKNSENCLSWLEQDPLTTDS